MSCRTCSEILKRTLPLLAVCCLLGCKPASSPVKHVSLPAVQVLKVQDASPAKAVFVGYYEASRSIPLAPTQAGRLTSVSVVSGQYVHQGDILAVFEDRLLLEVAAQAQGEVDAARAELNQAAAAYKRSRGLDAIGGLNADDGAFQRLTVGSRASSACQLHDGLFVSCRGIRLFPSWPRRGPGFYPQEYDRFRTMAGGKRSADAEASCRAA